MNPAISLNALFLGRLQEGSGPEPDGLRAQEFELAVTSVVDPYLKAKGFVAFEPSPDGAEAEVAVEEVYVQTLALPPGWSLRAGRLLLPLGRHNRLHTHQFPFTEVPVGIAGILGEESQGDVAVELSYAPPLPWYANALLLAGDGANAELFDAGDGELALGGRWENLWELTEAATLEAAVSVLRGPTPGGRHRTFYAVDLRYKWSDLRRTYGRALEASAELVGRTGSASSPDPLGLLLRARYRLARRLWIGGGYSALGTPAGRGREWTHELRGVGIYAPSSFSALRLELSWLRHPDGRRRLGAALQLNVTIGAHPAHSY
jgi:hypothetical protein